jgi:hypothetical protein
VHPVRRLQLVRDGESITHSCIRRLLMTSLTLPRSPYSARPTRMPSWPLGEGSRTRPRSVRRFPPSAAGPGARTNTSPCCTTRTTSCSRSNLERLSRAGSVGLALLAAAAPAAAAARAVLLPHRSHRPRRPYRGRQHHSPTSDDRARFLSDFRQMVRLDSRDQNRSGMHPQQEEEHQRQSPPRRRLGLLAHSWYHRYGSQRSIYRGSRS